MEFTCFFWEVHDRTQRTWNFADELLLALDEVEFPFNLDYIYRWKLFVVGWLKNDPHIQLCELSLHLHGWSTFLLQWLFLSELEIRNRPSPLVILKKGALYAGLSLYHLHTYLKRTSKNTSVCSYIVITSLISSWAKQITSLISPRTEVVAVAEYSCWQTYNPQGEVHNYVINDSTISTLRGL